MRGMNELKKLSACCLCLALLASPLLAHPHFQKTTSVKLSDDVKLSVSYFTVPSNETHAQNAEKGAFLAPGLAKLEIPTELKAGAVAISAGTYTVGAIKDGEDAWTMALSPGSLKFGESPDMSKLIKLESSYSRTSGEGVGHLLVDIEPGSGKLAGKMVVVIGFGKMFLSGVVNGAAK